MNNLMDMHSHTIASGHAYSTIKEMVEAASEKGLKMLGITEHAPEMPETCSLIYFANLKIVERELFGVELLLGVELNIMDYNGKVDMPDDLLAKSDVTIASMHRPCLIAGTMKKNTKALIKCMENKYVDIIGHPDDDYYPLDYEELAKAAKENDTLLEVNASSLRPTSIRAGARENYKNMLKYCEKYGTKIIVNSDSHFMTAVGKCENAFEMLEELGFPNELILNDKPEEVKKYLQKYKNNL